MVVSKVIGVFVCFVTMISASRLETRLEYTPQISTQCYWDNSWCSIVPVADGRCWRRTWKRSKIMWPRSLLSEFSKLSSDRRSDGVNRCLVQIRAIACRNCWRWSRLWPTLRPLTCEAVAIVGRIQLESDIIGTEFLAQIPTKAGLVDAWRSIVSLVCALTRSRGFIISWILRCQLPRGRIGECRCFITTWRFYS